MLGRARACRLARYSSRIPPRCWCMRRPSMRRAGRRQKTGGGTCCEMWSVVCAWEDYTKSDAVAGVRDQQDLSVTSVRACPKRFRMVTAASAAGQGSCGRPPPATRPAPSPSSRATLSSMRSASIPPPTGRSRCPPSSTSARDAPRPPPRP